MEEDEKYTGVCIYNDLTEIQLNALFAYAKKVYHDYCIYRDSNGFYFTKDYWMYSSKIDNEKGIDEFYAYAEDGHPEYKPSTFVEVMEFLVKMIISK